MNQQATFDKLDAALALVEEARQEFSQMVKETPVSPPAPDSAPAPIYRFKIKNLTVQVPSTLRLETLMTTVIDHLKAINGSVDDMAAIARKIADEYIGTVAALTDQLEAAVAAGAITPELIAEAEKATNKVAALKLQLVALDDLKPDPVPAPNPVL